METITKIIEIYKHVLGLPDISLKIISLLVESTENLIRDYYEGKACEELAPSLCNFVNALFSIECYHYYSNEVESTLTAILHLYRFLFDSSFWKYIPNKALINVIYSMQSIYCTVLDSSYP